MYFRAAPGALLMTLYGSKAEKKGSEGGAGRAVVIISEGTMGGEEGKECVSKCRDGGGEERGGTEEGAAWMWI